MASSNIVRVVPIDHASSPLNGTWRSSLDTCGPYADVDIAVSFIRNKRDGGKLYLIWIRAGVAG